MTIATDMKLVLSQVITDLGEPWTHAARTSKRDVNPPTFGTFTAIAAVPTGMNDNAEEIESGDTIIEFITVRVPATAGVNIGDQMKDPNGRTYHVSQQVSSGYGTDQFTIKRARRDALGKLREGGF